MTGQPTASSAATLQHQAYDFVKARIMSMEYKPGQYVTDSEVAEALDISRTPVREALRRLEQEGLLINQARRGWKVYTLSLEDIHDIFDIKEALEGMVARRAAANPDEASRSALGEAMARMQQAAQGDDVEAWMEADVRLHHVVLAMGSNERAANVIQQLNDQWHRVRVGFLAMKGRIARSNLEHKAIVDSILAGEEEEAERLMRVHLHHVRDELVRLLEHLVLPFVEEGI
jgi:DNA-binding GntR family transcriptional regulator